MRIRISSYVWGFIMEMTVLGITAATITLSIVLGIAIFLYITEDN